MFSPDPAAKTHSRLGFMLVMTFALHVAVILGLGFALDVPKAKPAKRIDITLSHYNQDEPVLDADFLAQSNQAASGIESVKKEMTTTQIAEIDHQNDNQVQQQKIKQQHSQQSAQLRITSSDADKSIEKQEALSEDTNDNHNGADELTQRQKEIAALKARLAEQKQAYARLPKKRRLSSVATKSSADAAYLFAWQQRIEAVGNDHYPKEARENAIYGELQLVVTINKDGKLASTNILKSSGEPLLDKAALRIVRLSSPFEPVPADVLKGANQLEIVRTWMFKRDRFSQQL
ncbi:MAG: energy transducer TonB [Cellvibrionales bacterium]|nr:energy transducer TonB [Cellvibrionales bacterium]